jgi:hypothetical protein
MLIDFERATLAASPPLKKKARSSKRIKSQTRRHRRHGSADNNHQLQQIGSMAGFVGFLAKCPGK